jgi:hypothetical protein
MMSCRDFKSGHKGKFNCVVFNCVVCGCFCNSIVSSSLVARG